MVLSAGFLLLTACGNGSSDSSGDQSAVSQTAEESSGYGLPGTEELKQQYEQATEATSEFAQNAKTEFVQSMQKELGNLNAEIEDLQQDVKELSGKAKIKAQEQIEKLNSHQGIVKEKLEALKESGTNAWQDIMEGVSAAYQDLKKAYEEARTKIEQNPEP